MEYFFFEKDLDGFFLNMIEVSPWKPQSLFTINKWIDRIWGWNEFEIKLYEINVTSSYLAEFKTFFQEFKKSNYAEWIEFNFLNIPVQKK